MLSFTNLKKSYQGKPIITGISGRISPGEKIGLIGVNGIGKTTLLKLIIGQETADEGLINFSSSTLKILSIDQYPSFATGVSLFDEVYSSNLAYNIERSSYQQEAEVKKALTMLGFTENRWHSSVHTLSGGEKTKIQLAKLLIYDFDLLLLDEPTNHLDLKTLQWLEDYLIQLNKTYLLISHDRYFLNRVVKKIWELTKSELRVYTGNYENYKKQKFIENQEATKRYDKEQTQIAHLREEITSRKNWYDRAHRAAGQNDFLRSKAKKHATVIRAKKRKLEKLIENKIEKPKQAPSPAFEIINKGLLNQKIPRHPVRTENLFKRYGKKEIFSHVSFAISRGDKIGVIGENGTGKTTLLKIIAGLDKDYEGLVCISPSVQIGYFDQELNNLHPNHTILEEVTGASEIMETEARTLLASLLFPGNTVYKLISSLSMGEKSRVSLAKIILSAPNLLILDEPTNYLDIVAKEKIERVLTEFTGTILFVSHDRYFLQQVANKIIHIEKQRLWLYPGGYDYYQRKRQLEQNDQFQHTTITIREEIARLECELSFLAGKLDSIRDEEEKETLSAKYLFLAKKANFLKAKLK